MHEKEAHGHDCAPLHTNAVTQNELELETLGRRPPQDTLSALPTVK